MKKSLQIVLSIATAIASVTATAGERVGDFALIDHLGAQHHMAWYDDQHAVVILPQAVGATDEAALQRWLICKPSSNNKALHSF